LDPAQAAAELVVCIRFVHICTIAPLVVQELPAHLKCHANTGDDDSAKEYNSKSPRGMVSHGTDMSDSFKVRCMFGAAAMIKQLCKRTQWLHRYNTSQLDGSCTVMTLKNSVYMPVGPEENVFVDEAEAHHQVVSSGLSANNTQDLPGCNIIKASSWPC
jgi:hypothetical protein